MEKLKCSSCGGQLQVEENKEYAVCEHCGARYKLNEDLNVNINLDDNMKEVLNNGLGTAKHFSKFMIIPIAAFIIIFIISIFTIFKTKNKTSDTTDNLFNSYEEQLKAEKEAEERLQNMTEEQLNQYEEENKKNLFNMKFNGDNGTKSAFLTKYILDDIIQSNKTHDKLITLAIDGKETTDEAEIIEIKHSLDGEYEVSIDYDDAGYINKIKIDKIN